MAEAHHQVTGPEEAPKPTPLFEAAILVSLAVAVLALFLFAWLGTEVLQGDTQHFDLTVRWWIHGFASPGMTRAMTAPVHPGGCRPEASERPKANDSAGYLRTDRRTADGSIRP